MSTKRNTNKNKNKNKTTVRNYYKNKFKNSPLLPYTNILMYIKTNFNAYLDLKTKIRNEGTGKLITLDDCFNMNNMFEVGLRKYTFDSPINGNPSMVLNKLIAYSYYIKSFSMFINKSKLDFLQLLKYQMGKDIRRQDRTINGKQYDSSLYIDENKSNYDIADLFYQSLIDAFSPNKQIDYDIINKIMLLSSQNMYNLITDLISEKLSEITHPEKNSVFRPTKIENIIINNEQTTMEYVFESKIIMSRDGGMLEPEYPCGMLSFKLLFDLKADTFKFTSFKLSYNINKCGPEIESTDETAPNEQKRGVAKWEYALPAGIGMAGLITAPFLLGVLGGKKRTKQKTKKKRIKRNKSFRNKIK